jgi:hypothetical protein
MFDARRMSRTNSPRMTWRECGSVLVAHVQSRQIAERHARRKGVAGLVADAILVVGRRVADCIEPLDRVAALI